MSVLPLAVAHEQLSAMPAEVVKQLLLDHLVDLCLHEVPALPDARCHVERMASAMACVGGQHNAS